MFFLWCRGVMLAVATSLRSQDVLWYYDYFCKKWQGSLILTRWVGVGWIILSQDQEYDIQVGTSILNKNLMIVEWCKFFTEQFNSSRTNRFCRTSRVFSFLILWWKNLTTCVTPRNPRHTKVEENLLPLLHDSPLYSFALVLVVDRKISGVDSKYPHPILSSLHNSTSVTTTGRRSLNRYQLLEQIETSALPQ